MLKAMIFAISLHGLTLGNIATAQTQILPERKISDPRLAQIREKLNRTLVQGRATTTLIYGEGIRKTDEERRITGILADLSASAGLTPILSRYSNGHQLVMIIRNNSKEDDSGVSQTLVLELLDAMNEAGPTLLMRSSIELRCPIRPYNTLAKPQPTCDVDDKVLQELFLRLR